MTAGSELWEAHRRAPTVATRNAIFHAEEDLLDKAISRARRRTGGGRRTNDHTDDELRSPAAQALLEQIDRFDHTRGYEFGAYAMPRLVGAILDTLRGEGWVPLRDAQLGLAARDIAEDLRRHGYVDQAAVAAQLGVDRLPAPTMLHSIDAKWVAGMPDDDVVDPAMLSSTIVRTLVKAIRMWIEDLPEQEATVITLSYLGDGEGPVDVAEIAARLGMTKSGVSQIRQRAFARFPRGT